MPAEITRVRWSTDQGARIDGVCGRYWDGIGEVCRHDALSPQRFSVVGVRMALQDELWSAVDGRRGAAGADRLCEACVTLLDVDGAAISLVFDGVSTGTLGCSGPSARRYDELQFTLGEGPCLDSVARRGPVAVPDLAHPEEVRWPAYAPAMVGEEIRSVYAMPVMLAGEYVGALDLFRARPGRFDDDDEAGAVAAAEIAGVPVLDLLGANLQAAINDPASTAWAELHVLTRTEVSQATGVLVAQLGIEPAEALVRLRAHAYGLGRSATDVARDILDRRIRLRDQ